LKAGILSKHLTIALEPEAASLFCQYLPVEKFSVGGQTKFSDAKPGTTYMIVDLGGKLSNPVHYTSIRSTCKNDIMVVNKKYFKFV
jgi:hypothetical protein